MLTHDSEHVQAMVDATAPEAKQVAKDALLTTTPLPPPQTTPNLLRLKASNDPFEAFMTDHLGHWAGCLKA